LRTVILREGRRTGCKMVMLTVSGRPEFACSKRDLLTFVQAIQEEGMSIFLRIQQAIKGQETQMYEMHLAGPDILKEELEIVTTSYRKKLFFAISPTAFFQPNSMQAEKLYAKALEMTCMTQRQRIVDLYAGTATLGILLAPFAEKVLSIEINPYAVFDAERNRELNAISNLIIRKGDVAIVLQEMWRQDPLWKDVDLAIIDPPRAGLTNQAMHVLLQLSPREILYISCFPPTQARDCSIFQQHEYQIVNIQPIDQFPHTVHVENIVLLRKYK